MLICSKAGKHTHCGDCTHGRPHKKTSQVGRTPIFGRCQEEYCYSLFEEVACVDVDQGDKIPDWVAENLKLKAEVDLLTYRLEMLTQHAEGSL